MRLTKDEIVLVAVVLLALVAGAAVRHWRGAHPHGKTAAPATPAPVVARAK